MGPQQIVERVAARGGSIQLQLVRQVLDLCGQMDQGLIEAHFCRVRNLPKYLRDFSGQQMAEHLRLLAGLSDQALVEVAARAAQEPGLIDVVVAGVDLMGVSACVTGCLTEMGLSITQMDVITYESSQPPPGGDVLPADVAAAVPQSAGLPADRYVMAMRVLPRTQCGDTDSLSATLRARLKAAYWHLVRGDFQKARHESDDQDELVGQTIDGRFRLERFLGQGGTGALYLATQLDLGRPVAVKVLRSEFSGDEDSFERFQREAHLMGQVHSAHVVHVYAAGRFRDRSWMALEYMSGGDVAHWTGRHGAPTAELAVRWLHDALEGLGYIHRDVGILHQDIKPQNMLLDAGLNLKIGDLGLSDLHLLARLSAPDGSIRGTLWYMSPEQARGERTDERSDLFSLGSAFYHIVSGMRPFDASTPAEVLARVARADHEPLSRAAPETPFSLAVVVDRLMQPHPLARYQDAAVALADLESYLTRGRLGDSLPEVRPAGRRSSLHALPPLPPADDPGRTPSTIVRARKAETK